MAKKQKSPEEEITKYKNHPGFEDKSLLPLAKNLQQSKTSRCAAVIKMQMRGTISFSPDSGYTWYIYQEKKVYIEATRGKRKVSIHQCRQQQTCHK